MRSLSPRTIRHIRSFLERHGDDPGAPALIAALAESRRAKRSVKAARARRVSKHATKKGETARIRAAVFERAGGRCEVTYDQGRCPNPPTDLAHLFGKKHRRQTERNCAAACVPCHRWLLTLNEPSAEACWRNVAATLERLGFRAEAADAWDKVFKAEVKASLPAAPRLGP